MTRISTNDPVFSEIFAFIGVIRGPVHPFYNFLFDPCNPRNLRFSV